MSKTQITIERINEVVNHPDADRLDIVQVLGYKVIVGRDEFKVGDAVVYFPPDILIPSDVAQKLGVEKYLKNAFYPGDSGASQCRVSSCRLRGVPSHGFVVGPIPHVEVFGVDVTFQYLGFKYEPPVRHNAGNAARGDPRFGKYTTIENIQRHASLFEVGENVCITEKIHGTNCRMGKIEGEYMAGSHSVQRKNGPGLYWQFMGMVKPLLDAIDGDVIVYGEIFGEGVQDLDYGQSLRAFRAFDVVVNGHYLDWSEFISLCNKYNVPVVPILYIGPYTPDLVETYTYGPSTFTNVKSKFKDREGCVVKPLTERVDRRGNRVILKSVSADYRDRKGATDIE